MPSSLPYLVVDHRSIVFSSSHSETLVGFETTLLSASLGTVASRRFQMWQGHKPIMHRAFQRIKYACDSVSLQNVYTSSEGKCGDSKGYVHCRHHKVTNIANTTSLETFPSYSHHFGPGRLSVEALSYSRTISHN